MNATEIAIIAAFLAVYLAAFGLFHLMIWRVNRNTPTDEKIPHSLYWGRWNHLRLEYKRIFPRSAVYEVTLALAVIIMILAVLLALFGIYSYATNT